MLYFQILLCLLLIICFQTKNPPHRGRLGRRAGYVRKDIGIFTGFFKNLPHSGYGRGHGSDTDGKMRIPVATECKTVSKGQIRTYRLADCLGVSFFANISDVKKKISPTYSGVYPLFSPLEQALAGSFHGSGGVVEQASSRSSRGVKGACLSWTRVQSRLILHSITPASASSREKVWRPDRASVMTR